MDTHINGVAILDNGDIALSDGSDFATDPSEILVLHPDGTISKPK